MHIASEKCKHAEHTLQKQRFDKYSVLCVIDCLCHLHQPLAEININTGVITLEHLETLGNNSKYRLYMK